MGICRVLSGDGSGVKVGVMVGVGDICWHPTRKIKKKIRLKDRYLFIFAFFQVNPNILDLYHLSAEFRFDSSNQSNDFIIFSVVNLEA
jgi:hypothetical protein